MIEIRFTTDAETAYQPMSDDVTQKVLKVAETENLDVPDAVEGLVRLGHFALAQHDQAQALRRGERDAARRGEHE